MAKVIEKIRAATLMHYGMLTYYTLSNKNPSIETKDNKDKDTGKDE